MVVDLMTGATAYEPGPSHPTTVRLPEGTHHVEIWLPHNEVIDLGELRSDAALEEAEASAPRWLHHGSSISHGSNAEAPSEIWPAVAARLAGVELRNLGLDGSAVVDQFTARVMRDTEGRRHQRQARHQRREP